MKMSRLVTCVGVFALLAGCSPVPPQETEPAVMSGVKGFTVNLEVADDGRGNQTLVNRNDRTKGCDKFPDEDKYRKGCIVAGVNEMVKIKFNLTGARDWYFAAFQVCDAEKLIKPDDFDHCRLTDEQRADWLVLANGGIALPEANGRVDITAFGAGLRQFEVRDLNWMKGYYFYGVLACTGTGDDRKCLWTDPGGENNGRLGSN
jgi:hypothetical protein